MKKIKVSLFVMSMIFVSSASALNLKEAVNIALEKNLDIKSSQYDYMESLQNIKTYNSTFMPKVNATYAYTNTNETNIGQESENVVAGLSASYNLFNGFKDSANKKSSKYLAHSSQYLLKAKKYDIILDTKTAYINYLNAKNTIETYESSYKLYKQQFEDAKNRYEQGLIAKNDFLQVQVFMAQAKQNIVSAKGNLKTAKYTLSNILGGMNLDSEIIENLDEQKLQDFFYDEKELEKRSEIEALKMNLKSVKQLQKVAKASDYPTVNASVSHNRYFDTFSLKRMDEPIKEKQNIATLNASWNLYDGGYDKSQKAIYKIRYLKAKNQLEDTKLAIKLQYENAKSALNVASDNLKTAQLSLLQAKENYSIVNNRYNEGIATTTELTDANYLLTQAKQKYDKAYFDKYLAIATLDRIFEKTKEVK